MKTCPNCGTSCADNIRFCPNCGTQLPESPSYSQAGASQPHYEQSTSQPHYDPNTAQPRYEPGPGYQPSRRRQPRSVALAIILSLITCGIYYLYWFVVLNDEINELSGDTKAPSGIVALLLTIITCGIYGLYWAYVMGRKASRLNGTSDSGILNLIVALFGFQLINLALFQDAANRYAG